MTEYDIFLSYRRTDSDMAKALVDSLESRGLRVWWDQKIGAGQDWRDSIVENLESSSVLVILFSENCNASKQLKKELAVADHIDKKVIPVLIEETEPKGHFLYELAGRNWIQVFPDALSKVEKLGDGLLEVAEIRRGQTATTVADVPEAPANTATAVATEAGVEGSATPQTATSATDPPTDPPAVEPPATTPAVSEQPPVAEAPPAKKKQKRDYLPYAWWDILPIGIGAAALLEMNPDPELTTVVGMACLSAAIYGTVAFPIRYFLRKRSPYRVLKSLLLSNLTLFMVFVAALAAYAAGKGGAEELGPLVVLYTIVFLGFGVVGFVLFFVMSKVRARGILRRNTRKI